MLYFSEMKKFHYILPLVFTALLFSCSQKRFMNIEEIPLPSEAKQGKIDGRYEVELDGATNAILNDLKKTYSKTEEKILFLPGEAGAAKIFEFYAPKLAEKGFSKDANVPLNNRNYQLNVWRSDGWLGGQAVAVAVIDAGKDAEGKPTKFLAVYSAEK